MTDIIQQLNKLIEKAKMPPELNFQEQVIVMPLEWWEAHDELPLWARFSRQLFNDYATLSPDEYTGGAEIVTE